MTTTTTSTFQVSFNREALLTACETASRCIASKPKSPLLGNLKLTSLEGNRLQVLSTDLDLGARIEIGATVEQIGETLVAPQFLIPILRQADDMAMSLELLESGELYLRGKGKEFSSATEKPESFPDFPEFPEENVVSLEPAKLALAIQRTIFVPTESKFGATSGIALEWQEEQLSFTATDGTRLASQVVPCGGSPRAQETPWLVPTKPLRLLEGMLRNLEEPVLLSLTRNDFMARCGPSILYSRLLEGTFPTWRRLVEGHRKIEGATPRILRCSVEELRRCIALASATANAELSYRLDFALTQNRLSVRATQAEGLRAGKSLVEIPVDYLDEPIEVLFHGQSLLEFLKILEGTEKLKIEFRTPKTGIFFILGSDDSYTYLSVPLFIPSKESTNGQ